MIKFCVVHVWWCLCIWLSSLVCLWFCDTWNRDVTTITILIFSSVHDRSFIFWAFCYFYLKIDDVVIMHNWKHPVIINYWCENEHARFYHKFFFKNVFSMQIWSYVCLAGWVVAWLAGSLPGWLGHCLASWLSCWLVIYTLLFMHVYWWGLICGLRMTGLHAWLDCMHNRISISCLVSHLAIWLACLLVCMFEILLGCQLLPPLSHMYELSPIK